ncbi:MAG: helix-turn-helix transcriptional regulator, partial [Planctomycetes bacterium]|nr:helix-turn-helix transcriptional regulator [Planctomycetota bacterium]
PERTRGWVDFALGYLGGGRGVMEHKGGVVNLVPGTCLILRGGEDYAFRSARGGAFRQYWVHYDYLDGKGRAIPLDRVEAPPLSRLAEDPQLLELLLSRLVQCVRDGGAAAGLTEVWFSAIMAEISRIDSDVAEESRCAKNDDRAWVEKICRDIREQPEKDWPVARMARELGVCRSHFYKIFRRITSRSPQQFVMEERMRLARMLLRESANSIGWIADKLGYSDQYFFSHHFKAFHGESPSSFRKSQES